MANGLAKRISVWIEGMILTFLPPSKSAYAGGGVLLPAEAGHPDGAVFFSDKKKKLIVSVPLVCCGYLPPAVRMVLDLRSMGFSDAMIAQVAGQEETWKNN